MGMIGTGLVVLHGASQGQVYMHQKMHMQIGQMVPLTVVLKL